MIPGRSRSGSRRRARSVADQKSVVSALDRVLDTDILWSVVFVVAALFLVQTAECGPARPQWTVGTVAETDIVTEREAQVPDEALTEEKRLAARAGVPDVYVFDVERGEALARLFRSELAQRESVSAEVAERIVDVLRDVLSEPVVANRAILERSGSIRIRRVPSGTEEVTSEFDHVLGLAEARRRVRAAVARFGEDRPREVLDDLGNLAADFVDVTLTFDRAATDAWRESSSSEVLPVTVTVPAGTVLLRKGERVTPEVLERIESAFEKGSGPEQGWVAGTALLVLVVLLAVFLYRYAVFHQRRFRRVQHLHALLSGSIVLTLLVARGTLWVASEVAERFPEPFGNVATYGYLAPVGAGAILVALLANGRIAMVFSVFVATLFGGMQGWDAPRTLWALLVQWTAVYAITTYRERTALLRAGLIVGSVGAVVALAVEALRIPPPQGALVLYGAALAFVGGAVGIGLLVSFALPPLETVFRVLTDVRLLELSNVNNPLLSELALKAPGTYNHSMTVGTLAEEAAKAIGANSLFCRVAAAYHDVGKMNKPEYFVENQRGSNPHDRLTPSMSALIIASHVKDGIRLARQARLPEQIVDIIPQHHGTRLMTFFYDKARRQNSTSGREPNEDDFRYPGPKPRTREAAIFMLADGIEAAARTVDDATPNRLQEVIRKVANVIVLDGQLEECDLTFADLEKIEAALLRALTSMYHHRVEYPGFDFGRTRAEGRSGEARTGRGSS